MAEVAVSAGIQIIGDRLHSPGPSQPLQKRPDWTDVKGIRTDLCRAAFNGKWETVQHFYETFKLHIPATITKRDDTALHIAATGHHTFYVRELVKLMTKEELALKNKSGHTAFFLAAGSGNKKLCQIMVEKNEDLAMIPDNVDMLPIHVASLSGHKDVTHCLYKLIEDQLNEKYRVQLLVNSTCADLYDIALDLVQKHPLTAIGRDAYGVTALHVLSRKNLASLNLANQNQRGLLKSCFNKCIKNNRSKLHSQALELTKHIWKTVVSVCDDSEISSLIRDPWELIFVAAEVGNVEFLSLLISDYPDLIWEHNREGHSICHTAVKHRQNEIFKLLNEFRSVKPLILASIDSSGNNILHLAGRLGPAYRLNNLSKAAPGTALQMQQELLWFKAVEMVTRPGDAEAINKEGKTPWDVFHEEHKQLKLVGEEWIKNTSNSLMVVAALVATMVFTAALTVPGGYNGDTGVPVFNQQLSFRIFAVSVAISLVSSLTSILFFISLHTSSYKIDDFLWRLPMKLMSGLLALFLAVASMMIIFCATFFIVFREGLLGFAYTLYIIASVVVLLFIRQQYRLFIDALRLTFNPWSYFYSKPISSPPKKGEAVGSEASIDGFIV